MFIREVSVTTQIVSRNDVYRIESCSEYSEQEILQMLHDKKVARFFDDQIAPHCFISTLDSNSRRLAVVYYEPEHRPMITSDTVRNKEVTYSLFE